MRLLDGKALLDLRYLLDSTFTSSILLQKLLQAGFRAYVVEIPVGTQSVQVTGLDLDIPVVSDIMWQGVISPSLTAPGNRRITAHAIKRTDRDVQEFSLSGTAEVEGYKLVGFYFPAFYATIIQ